MILGYGVLRLASGRLHIITLRDGSTYQGGRGLTLVASYRRLYQATHALMGMECQSTS